MLGKIFSSLHFEYFIFPRKTGFAIHANCLLGKETICTKNQSLFSGKKENINFVAERTQGGKVDTVMTEGRSLRQWALNLCAGDCEVRLTPPPSRLATIKTESYHVKM